MLRLRVLAGVLLALLAVATPAAAVVVTAPAGRVVAQERPTKSQPPAGESLKENSRPVEEQPWSYNWVARPTIVIVALFLFALALGYVMRWIGLGRRTS